MSQPFKVLLYILGCLFVSLFVLFNYPSGATVGLLVVLATVLGVMIFSPKKTQTRKVSDAEVAKIIGSAVDIRVITPSEPSTNRDELGFDDSNLDAAQAAMYQIEEAHFRELRFLREVKTLHPIAFERFVMALFKHQGYECEHTKASGDQGVDLFVRKEGKTGVVQCKRLKGVVGQPVVRDLYGAMLHNQADEAFLVCTSNFSAPAQEWSQDKPIHLIHSKILMTWVRKFGADQETD